MTHRVILRVVSQHRKTARDSSSFGEMYGRGVTMGKLYERIVWTSCNYERKSIKSKEVRLVM